MNDHLADPLPAARPLAEGCLATALSAPRPLDPRRIVLVALAIVGAVLVRPAIAGNAEVDRNTVVEGAWTAVAACTALVSVLHAVWCGRAQSTTGVLVRSVAMGMALGVLNAGLSLAAATALTPTAGPGEVLHGFFMGCVFGCLLGGFWGMAFGLAYAPLISLVVAQRRAPTAEDGDVALIASGVALLLAGVLREAALEEGLTAAFAPAGPDPAWGTLALVATIGLAGALRGVAGVVGRRGFVARVRDGDEPGWRVLAAAAAPTASGLPRLLRSDAPAAVLCRVQQLGSGAYRAGEGWTAIALVPAAAGHAADHAPANAPARAPEGAPENAGRLSSVVR